MSEETYEIEQDYRGYRLQARRLDYGRNECVITRGGRLTAVVHGYGDAKSAIENGKKQADQERD